MNIDKPTIVTPTIAATDWTNANHAHAAANSGGLISVTPAMLSNASAQYKFLVSGATPFAYAESPGALNIASGKTLKVSNTLTLAGAIDGLTLTGEVSGYPIVRLAGFPPAPQIVADPLNGNARGIYAVDLQLYRINATEVASGNEATIIGGQENTASGGNSTVVGGYGNVASGDYYSTVVGGATNVASARYSTAVGGFGSVAGGQYTVAMGRQAKTGTNNGVFIFGDSTAADFNGIVADEFALRARGGFRHAYDGANYWTAKVASNGVTTFATLPIGAGFVFTPPVTLSSVTASTFVYANASQVLVSLANATGYLLNDGSGVFSYSATVTATAHNLFSTTHGDTTGAASPVDGDIIIGNVTPKWSKLAITIPAAGTLNYLGVNNGELRPSWKSASANPGATAAILASAPTTGLLTLAALTVSATITGAVSGNAGTVTNGVYTNAANSMTLINPLTTIAESWIGPSSTAGIYFKAGNVGIGTTGPISILHIRGDFTLGLPPGSGGSFGRISSRWNGDPARGEAAAIDFIRPNANWGNEGEIRFFTNPGDEGQGASSQRMVIDRLGNVGIGTTVFGTSAATVLGIGNGTEPSTSPADMVQLYSVDLPAGNATLGLRTETAVVTETVTSDSTLSVRINGATYKICLKA
jgi:hypothetical protein